MLKVNLENFTAILLFIMGYVLISPLFTLLKVSSSLIFLFLFCIYFLLSIKQKKKINKSFLLFLMLGISFILTSFIFIYQKENIFTALIFFSSLFIIRITTKSELIKMTKIASKFISFLIFGSFISLIYLKMGGSELYTFLNPDGRTNYLFPFTLTNSFWNELIRPAGIYDEPGAFSFFICSTVVLRDLLGFSKRNSLVMLISGLITLSLAHVIFLIIYFLNFRFSLRNLFLYFSTMFLGFIYLSSIDKSDILYNVFFIRFTVNTSGKLIGDNRSQNLLNAYELLKNKPQYIMTGIPKKSDLSLENNKEYGANPLGFILNYGLVLFIPYFIIVLIFLSSISKGLKYSSLFGFGLLILQRDYLYVLCYGFLISACLLIYLRRVRD